MIRPTGPIPELYYEQENENNKDKMSRPKLEKLQQKVFNDGKPKPLTYD